LKLDVLGFFVLCSGFSSYNWVESLWTILTKLSAGEYASKSLTEFLSKNSISSIKK